ncbi:MAG: hypothetical protein KGS49_19110 [Planctomycetes bacterium]|nr:hypothetical protein [Planctomycetota bacterium]
MSIEVTCQACRKTYRVKEDVSGKKIRCPSCKEIVVVPVLVQEFYVEDSVQRPAVPSGPKGPSGRVPGRSKETIRIFDVVLPRRSMVQSSKPSRTHLRRW